MSDDKTWRQKYPRQPTDASKQTAGQGATGQQPAGQQQQPGPKNGTSQKQSGKDPPLTRRESKPPAGPQSQLSTTSRFSRPSNISTGTILTPAQPLGGHNDHRIVMALAAVCLKTGGEITDAQAVRKSLPDYWDRIAALGAEAELAD